MRRERATVQIAGRIQEQKILKHLLVSKKAEFLALYGRRRVGKTFLVKNFFTQSNCVFFHATGIQKGEMEEQIEQFSKQIGNTFYRGATMAQYKNWFDAFEALTKGIEQLGNIPIVLFFDEFPWMATRRSKILQALEYYWNRYWNHDSRIKLIICGSSASWIIEKIINSKGGLYNRITRAMRLDPMTLAESRTFLTAQGVRLNQKQILELYMAFGGIPHYLSLVRPGLSAHQCINELCFHKSGALVEEFERLFASLFIESDDYRLLVRIIAKARSGMNRTQIVKESKYLKGGRLTRKLAELEDAGFILKFIPHKHQKRGTYYKVIDEYTLFYLSWVEDYIDSTQKQDRSSDYWISKAQTPSWKSWAGLAFEAVCHKHVAEIRKALSIAPSSGIGAWRYVSQSRGKDKGAQIDLLFDRPDGVITICEIKHSDKSFCIDREYAEILKRKVIVYQHQTRTNKQIFLSMITSSSLKPSKYSEELISQSVGLDDLFRS